MVTRVGVAAAMVLGLLAAPASAKLYVSTTVAADGSGHVEGYRLSDATPPALVNDHLTLEVTRGGTSVGSVAAVGYAQLPTLAVQAGDVVTLTDADAVGGPEVKTVTVSGAPSFADAGLCGGRFRGVRDEGATVSVGSTGATAVAPAQVATGAGTAFSGGFSAALTSASALTAAQTLAVDPDFTVFSQNTAPIADCPAPQAAPVVPASSPAPAPPVAVAAPAPVAVAAVAPARDLIAPLGTLKLRLTNAYKSLRRGTFVATVTTTEPGTVSQTLTAAGRVLATAAATARQAGVVSLKLRLTQAGKSALSHNKTVAARLVTTVADTSGNARVLPPKRFTLKR